MKKTKKRTTLFFLTVEDWSGPRPFSPPASSILSYPVLGVSDDFFLVLTCCLEMCLRICLLGTNTHTYQYIAINSTTVCVCMCAKCECKRTKWLWRRITVDFRAENTTGAAWRHVGFRLWTFTSIVLDLRLQKKCFVPTHLHQKSSWGELSL